MPYAPAVDVKSQSFAVHKSISPKYISTIGGANLNIFRAVSPLNIFGRFTSIAAINTSAAIYINPSFIIYFLLFCLYFSRLHKKTFFGRLLILSCRIYFSQYFFDICQKLPHFPFIFPQKKNALKRRSLNFLIVDIYACNSSFAVKSHIGSYFAVVLKGIS